MDQQCNHQDGHKTHGVKNATQVLERGDPCRGCRSYTLVRQWHHGQLGPISADPVHRQLQGCTRLGNIVSLFMANNSNRSNWVEGASLLLLLR
jgi:hypothetical protein